MTKKNIFTLALQFLTALVLDVVFFSLTNPLRLPSLLIVVGFILLYLTAFSGLRLFFTAIHGWLPLGEGRIKRIAMLVSGLLMALLAMQSIGQLTVRDLVALVPLIAVLYFYVSYNGKHTSRDR